MFTRLFFRTAVAAFVLAACAVAASAQVMQINGKVTLRQADGTETPVQNAVVDIYRVDITQKFEIKTNRKGEYTHAGIPLTGIYTIAVSAPGARPTYKANVRLSQQPTNDFVLSQGDGSRLTLDQIKTFEGSARANAGPSTGPGGTAAPAAQPKESEEERKKREAEIARIEESNRKITNANEIVSRTFKAGNDALSAKRYDEAIAQYNEGIAAREEPALFANKSVALRQRGVDRFNAAIQAKSNDFAPAYQDWRDSAEAAKRALELVKADTTAATDPSAKANMEQNRLAAISSRAEALRLVATKADKTPQMAEEAFNAYQEYIALETDPAKKAKMQADAAKIFFDANVFDRAVQEFQKVLANDPDNAEANLYLGFSLFNTGDKAKFQDAANYLGKFADKAPETHPFKADARSILDFLKTQENIKPEKIQTARPARRGRG
jgi:tetratricopeptide (TPR) repeat protein